MERPWFHLTTQNLGPGDAYMETRASAPSGPVPKACSCSHPCTGGGTREGHQHMNGASMGWLQSPHRCFGTYPVSCVCMTFFVRLPQHFPRVALHRYAIFSHEPGRYNSNILVILPHLFYFRPTVMCTRVC